MKKTVLVLLAATTLGAAVVTSTAVNTAAPVQAADATATAIPYQRATAKVTAAAGAQVYSDAGFTKPIKGKVLPKGSSWRVYNKFGNGNPTNGGYSVGGSQFVKVTDVQLTDVKTAWSGTFTVKVQNHPTWATVLYDKNMKPIRSLPAGSRWKVYASYNIYGQNGHYVDQYYDLGNQQYVKYASFPKHDLNSGQYNGTIN